MFTVLCVSDQQQTWTCTLHSISACLRLISCSCTCRSLFCTVSVCTRSCRLRLSCSPRRRWLLWIWFCVSKDTEIPFLVLVLNSSTLCTYIQTQTCDWWHCTELHTFLSCLAEDCCHLEATVWQYRKKIPSSRLVYCLLDTHLTLQIIHHSYYKDTNDKKDKHNTPMHRRAWWGEWGYKDDLTCVSSSRILCRDSRSSAWASASRSLTLISSSCSSLIVFFFGASFQRPDVRAMWRWEKVLQSFIKITSRFVPIFMLHLWKISCLPASAPPGLWPAVSALSGQSRLPLPATSPRSAPPVAVLRWCHLVGTCSSGEDVKEKYVLNILRIITGCWLCWKTVSRASHLFHIKDLVLHLLECTLGLCLLQSRLYKLRLQLQDGLLRIARDSLLQPLGKVSEQRQSRPTNIHVWQQCWVLKQNLIFNLN